MDTGFKISAGGHGVLLLFAVVGWPFMHDSETMAPQSVSVSLISSADLPVVSSAAPPQAPQPRDTLAALPSVAPTPPQASVAPVSRPDPAPQAPSPQPPAVESAPPPPRVDRVAPVPQPAPPKDVPVGDVRQEAVQKRPETTAVVPPQPEQAAQAPKAAAPQIVTEATDTSDQASLQPSLAPDTVRRPPQRPERPAPVVQPQPPEPTPPAPAPEKVAVAEPSPPEPTPPKPTPPEPTPSEPVDVQDSVSAALAEALAAPTESATPQATSSGPPLTQGDRDGLRLAVSQCWNFSALSTDASKVTVVVGMSMTLDGQPSNLRMVSFDGGGQAAAQQAFDTARRAILRCAGEGYSLPREKYDQWREIEMTFNPDIMRRK
ncbi:hypothetical protein [Pseudoruegeria sp. SK021]|uniref:hypothetical protein n=1 Tax=Pseudoruegeria sp. SK021 TaxID=1933035 RepID=UPI000A243B87|nr:hypothetical protein [Pseudoruegeria sp. SK021]OSP56535.1 hypothetical protein BV911_00800 [Pseudoruegeria sp. SK021]